MYKGDSSLLHSPSILPPLLVLFYVQKESSSRPSHLGSGLGSLSIHMISLSMSLCLWVIPNFENYPHPLHLPPLPLVYQTLSLLQYAPHGFLPSFSKKVIHLPPPPSFCENELWSIRKNEVVLLYPR